MPKASALPEGHDALPGDDRLDGLPVDEERARKRMAVGLAPYRPTAKARPQRPPDSSSLADWAWFPPVLLVGAVLAISLLLGARLLQRSPGDWLQNRSSGAALVVPAPSYHLVVAEDFSRAPARLADGVMPDQWEMALLPDEARYRLRVWPGHLAWSLVGYRPDVPYRVQASMTVDPTTPWGMAGLLVRHQSEEDFYLFVVDGQGRFQVQRQQEGVLATVAAWETAPSLNRAGTANTLMVEDDGQALRFYGNMILLSEIREMDLPPGGVGLVAGVGETQPGDQPEPPYAAVSVDWFQLYQAVESGQPQ